MHTKDVETLHDLSEETLLVWLEEPPTQRRELQAFCLLKEAVGNLRSACINLGVESVHRGASYYPKTPATIYNVLLE